MNEKLKVGIIGLGGICRGAHMPGYLKMDNVEIVAVCDIDPKKLESLRIIRSFWNTVIWILLIFAHRIISTQLLLWRRSAKELTYFVKSPMLYR